MLVAMVMFTSMAVFIRLSAEELHAFVVVFFRNFLAVVLLAPWFLQRGLGVLRVNRWGLLASRSLVNIVGMTAGFVAITMIPLAEAMSLGFTAPLFATLGAVLVLGEVIRARRMIALAIGFAGVMLVLRPGFEAISVGSMLALTNAFTLAITALIVKRLTATEHPDSIVAWMVLLQSPLSLIPALFFWEWPTLGTWVLLFCLAGAGTLGHLCWTRAYTLVDMSQLQPMEFAKLPMAALIAYLVFAEVPSIWTWAGGIIIFASTAYISIREAQLARHRKT